MCLENSPVFPLVAMDRMAAPLVLLHVCKHWKDTALSTPTLWASLSVMPEDVQDTRLMATWLKRSARAPLRLNFEAIDSKIADVGLDVVLRHRSHWQHVTIDWSGRMELAPMLSSFNMPPTLRLETFKLITNFDIYYENEDVGVAAQLGILLKSSRSLRSFHWETQRQIYTDPSISLPGVAFNQLRRLHLGGLISLYDCMDILKRSPLLEECTLTFVGINFSQPSQVPDDIAVVMPALTSFTLKTHADTCQFFSALRLPCLTRLSIEYRDFDDDTPEGSNDNGFPDWPRTEFMVFLTQSACSISDLSLTVPITEADLVDCLKHVAPTLETLQIGAKFDWERFGRPTLALLTNRISPEGQVYRLFPRLKTIKLHDCLVGALAHDALVDMLESRWCFPEDEIQFVNPVITVYDSPSLLTGEDLIIVRRKVDVMETRGESGEINIILL